MDTNGVNQIIIALEAVYDAKVDNARRREAQAFLEEVKLNDELPYWGYQLALPDNGLDHIVRHFGLLLLQHAIRSRYHQLDQAKLVAIRNWVVELAAKTAEDEPHYIKEKIAFLWVAIAKRVWGSHLIKQRESDDLSDSEKEALWVSMDLDLWNLWNSLLATRDVSIIILRTLFEDIYIIEDPAAAMRLTVLNQLAITITTPDNVLDTIWEPLPQFALCKALSEGWFKAWAQFLVERLSQHDILLPECQLFVPKLLHTFKTCLHWILPQVLREENIMANLFKILTLDDTKIKTAAIDCLHILFTRNYGDDDFEYFVGLVFTAEGISNLLQFYHLLELDADDIDEQVYALVKKLVEMIVLLLEFLNISSKQKVNWETLDVAGYLKLVLITTNHPSLIVLGLLLQMWVTILRYDELLLREQIVNIIPELLQIASDRTINYQNDANNLLTKFLAVDFDSSPEADLFLNNYRKFCEDIVRISVCKAPEQGLSWLEQRLEQFFSSGLGRQCISEHHLDEKLLALNYGNAQFNVIENCIRGISRWRIWYSGEDFETLNERLNSQVEVLGERLLAMNLALPRLIRKQVQTLVQFAPLLKDQGPLMFKVLERILHTATYDYPSDIDDDERELIRDLRTLCGTELNRLAYIMPELLKNIFDDLENVISQILSSNKVTDHEVVAFKLFLLVIALRLLIENKDELFSKIVDPELAAWLAPDTEKGLLDLHWFMQRIGIVEIASYFQKRGINEQTNLLLVQMDAEGKDLRKRLRDHWLLIFPIRATRIFIQYSIEKLSHDLSEYNNLRKLWAPRVQPIIPHILQLLLQIQAYHNPANWRDLPESVRLFVRDLCLERFWQQGVSVQLKEMFIEENVKAALTLRDFADSVGHLIRYTREYAFLTIGLIAQLEDTLYEIPDVGQMLWNAVAGDTTGITLHSWKHMLNSCLRLVVKFCPVEHVPNFMLQLLPMAFKDLDTLLVTRWNKVYENGLCLGQGDTDDLSEEMMEEHMLRQLSATVVRFLMDIVSQLNAKQVSPLQVACRKLVSEDRDVMASFIQLSSHIIQFKDTKCSFNTVLIIRNIILEILLKDDEVDKYICDTLLPALCNILLDDYFHETHPEAAVTLTTIYCNLRGKSDYPARALLQCLPNVSTARLSNFEQLLVSSKTVKSQRGVLLDLIRVSKEDATNGTDDDDIAKRKQQLERVALSRTKKNAGGDVMNDPFTENGALTNLFGDD